MGLCNCFETTPDTCKHYQKPFAVSQNENKRDVCMHVCGPGKENENTEKDKNQGKAIISHGHSTHIFPISQFLCWRFVNSSVAHPTSVNILYLIEFSGEVALANTIHAASNQPDIIMTGRDVPRVRHASVCILMLLQAVAKRLSTD